MSVIKGNHAGSSGSDFYSYKINQSLRFDSASSTNLTRTAGTPSDGKKATWSWWMKKCEVTPSSPSHHSVFYSGSPNSDGFRIAFLKLAGYHNHQLIINQDNGSSASYMYVYTNAFYRDPSGWYHFVVSYDSTDSTAADRIKIYVNGTQQTISSGTNINPPLNHIPSFQVSGKTLRIGEGRTDDNEHINGYLAEVNFIDGTAYDASNFGETKDGVWVAKSSSGLTFGNNGFYLPFDDSSAIGDDESSNTNDFTANNFSAHDVVPDSPTNNFCTLNPIAGNGDSISEGNLKGEGDSGSGVFQGWTSTFAMSSGKWYWEVNAVDVNNIMQIGVHPTGAAIDTSTNLSYHTDSMIYNSGGTKAIGTGGLGDAPTTKTTTSYGASYTDGDIIGVALDLDSGTTTLTFYKNNSTQGAAFSNLASDEYTALYTGIDNSLGIFNFGQDGTFAGTKTAQGNADGNGIGDFYYAPPSGHLALCSKNLPDPTIVDGSDGFNTVLYTGNDTARSITGVGFQPDWVWLKSRSTTDNNSVFDVVRGVQEELVTNATSIEADDSTLLTAFGSDGFSIGTNSGINGDTKTFVSWNWKAGGSASSNSQGSVTSTVSANTSAGFSIVGWQGNETNSTIGHGLEKAPETIIVKSRGSTEGWFTYHASVGNTKRLLLNSDTSEYASVEYWNNTTPTSSVFTVGVNDGTNDNGYNMIAYCFHSVEGFSKMGDYVGNYNVNGPFVYTGFKPAFIIIKSAVTAGYHWYVMDSTRTAYNGSQAWLSPSQASTEDTSTGENVDILSNGFKIRTNWTRLNDSGSPKYIYIAFAESPFKFANAR